MHQPYLHTQFKFCNYGDGHADHSTFGTQLQGPDLHVQKYPRVTGVQSCRAGILLLPGQSWPMYQISALSNRTPHGIKAYH